jgi:hypothetical protein
VILESAYGVLEAYQERIAGIRVALAVRAARCRFKAIASGRCAHRTTGEDGDMVTAMVKAPWNDLFARLPQPHLLVAVLPDSSETESIFNAQSAQRLLVRLIRKLPTHGEFAVTVSRQSGRREILCAFGDSSDAALVAKATNASVSGRGRHSFVLDESAERQLIKIAGPPEKHRQPRTSPYDRWQS